MEATLMLEAVRLYGMPGAIAIWVLVNAWKTRGKESGGDLSSDIAEIKAGIKEVMHDQVMIRERLAGVEAILGDRKS